MNEPIQQPTSGAPEIKLSTHTVPWKIILPISIVVAALLSGGGVYLWQQNVKNSAVKDVTSQLTALQGKQAAENSTALSAAQEEIKKLESELLAEKVNNALFDKYQTIPQVFPDPKNSMVFYYVGKGSSGPEGDQYSIYQYDASKDEHYIQTKEVNLTLIDTSKQLYTEQLGVVGPGDLAFLKMYLDPIDLVNNQLVFHYMAQDDSPGPCWSPWTDRQLFAVDVTQTPPLKRTDFVMSQALKLQKEAEQKQCEREM